MHAEDAPAGSVEDELVETVLRAYVLRAGDRRQRMRDDGGVVTLLHSLGLGEPDAAQFRIREDRGRQRRIVGTARAVAEHVLDRDPGLVLRDRREHRPRRDVARSPDAVDVRSQTVVDGEAAAADLEADAIGLELLDIREAA